MQTVPPPHKEGVTAPMTCLTFRLRQGTPLSETLYHTLSEIVKRGELVPVETCPVQSLHEYLFLCAFVLKRATSHISPNTTPTKKTVSNMTLGM